MEKDYIYIQKRFEVERDTQFGESLLQGQVNVDVTQIEGIKIHRIKNTDLNNNNLKPIENNTI